VCNHGLWPDLSSTLYEAIFKLTYAESMNLGVNPNRSGPQSNLILEINTFSRKSEIYQKNLSMFSFEFNHNRCYIYLK
jgi:hypothetical protein